MQSLLKIIHSIKKLLYKRGRIELYEDYHKDQRYKNHKLKCQNHLFLIAGLPKSGTTWTENILNFTPHVVQLNKSILRNYPLFPKLEDTHAINQTILNSAPKNKLSFLKLHISPTINSFNLIKKNNLKVLIQIRDIRDMLISRFHHVINQKDHWDHRRLIRYDSKDRFIQSIKSINPDTGETIFDYYFNWIKSWINYSDKNKKSSMVLKYEDILLSKKISLEKILIFFDYNLDDKIIDKILYEEKKFTDNKKKNSLIKNINSFSRTSSTFRKGKSQNWKSELSKKEIDYINRLLKKKDFDLGYKI